METISIDKKFVTIYTESNPNPNSLKFVVNFMLLPEGMSTDFPDPLSAARCPLALDLFRYNFVRRVFISSNFITITKDEGMDWNDISPLLKPFIKGFLEEGTPLFLEEISSDIKEDDSEVVKKIKGDRKSTRLNSSHSTLSRMPSSA